MKGYHVSRSLSQHSAGPCHCMPEGLDVPGAYMPHPQEVRGTREHVQGHGNHAYYPPGGPPEPLPLPSSGGGTFPRSHLSQHPYDSCEECLSSGPGGHGHPGKRHHIPPGLLDQFERQVPFPSDGFHTLQYQRAASGGQRSESPGRIRHLVHSVQRLFAKSHSLEAPGKREYGEARGEHRERGGGHRSGGEESAPPRATTHQSRSARRSKSRERSKSGDSRHGERRERRHRGKTAGWWSSDDNLDSDSSFLVAGMGGRRGRGMALTGPEALDGAIPEPVLKAVKAKSPQGECVACSTMGLPGDTGHSLKRSTWTAMTVSQAREVYPSQRGGAYEKALVEPKVKERSYHYLQVPSDDWGGGYPGGEGMDGSGEIPCRRMRSGSYIKAMGDDDSGDSDPSPRASPRSALIAQREAFHRSISMDHRANAKFSCKECTDSYTPSRMAPKGHGRSRSYTRSLTSAQLGDVLNHQFDSVCESVFGEAESQAVEALDLPGCFRTRSHSYVRAIQAGCSQDDDCLSVFSISSPKVGPKAAGVFPYRKMAPPLPPRVAKPLIAVTAQSSTESTQDAYFLSTGQPSPRTKHSHSLDGLEAAGGRPSSRGGYYAAGRAKPHSNSTESLDGGRVPLGGTGSASAMAARAKHSSSADSLLEVTSRGSRERSAVILGKSSSLPQSGSGQGPAEAEHKAEGRRGKWRPSIAVQVDSSETISDSDTESKVLREVHSIGVQVEEDKRRARFKRSNSVTASVQADLETEGLLGLGAATQDKGLQFGCSFQRHSSEPESAGPYGEYRTVHTQGQWAYRDEYLHQQQQQKQQGGYASEVISRAPSPRPPSRAGWLEGPRSLPDSGRASPCPRDGELFLRLLQTEVERMEGWCQNMEREAEENDLPKEVLELIHGAVTSAQMLMSQKVQQFFRLCQQSMDPAAYPQPTSQDLAAFWDLLQLAIEDVRVKFQDLQRLKDSGWRLPSDRKEEKKPPPLLPKKPSMSSSMADAASGGSGGSVGVLVMSRSGRTVPLREKSLDLGERQRAELHGRLLPAKRAASFRQNSATESADSIEIYIPEAQTRL
ncbi:disks large-associated protein 3 [Brienomyrus brachyistius]|uniref:disks large-associated protein 3 n=1 Tax=Brienomyrus brachyistius TaxID=42636 RepID=UPI0020B21CE5|nr:disks large-associated protein 3 [Brienomyrus brachyistius]XP_048849357.1 disks large-associated protein 3 [Brienomyrus brachyistius]XP_048849358.1 disks large-associated protein 3 [Brienomyrus brachyistius]XP_048849360.1 disks large-associated protein 3 [Brienomyrus brachyistius]